MRALLLALAACGRLGFDATTDATSTTPQGTWRSIATNGQTTCALTVDDALWCWGDNLTANLGIGTVSSTERPQQIGFAHWQEVALGTTASCGLQTDGSLWCWGYNGFGELGAGAIGDEQKRPAAIAQGPWLHLAALDAAFCALKQDGSLWCWGRNNRGQLGNGGGPDLPRPMQSSAGPYTQLFGGLEYACALDAAHHGTCWGGNELGQLGVGDRTDRAKPTDLAGGHMWSTLAASAVHSCGAELDGTTWCWGSNDNLEVGTAASDSPIPAGAPPLTQLALGTSHSCGTDGTDLYCWGSTEHGAVGIAQETDLAPTRITAARAVAAAGKLTCIIDGAGAVACSGTSNYGQDGGAPGEVHTPGPSDTRTDWTDIAAESGHACGTTADNKTWCWGANYDAQIGDGTFRDRQVPIEIGENITDLALGEESSAGIRDGHAWLWGYAGTQQRLVPTDLGPADRIDTGLLHGCTLAGGGLDCSGDNAHGQLGNGSYTGTTSSLGSDWTTISTQGNATCGIQLGHLYCWGDQGTIAGAGSMTNQPAMIDIPGGASLIAVGGSHSCALGSGLYCYGANYDGQLGDGTLSDRDMAVQASPNNDWLELAAGDLHTCAIDTAHALFCWGHADEGQLGEPLDDARPTPTQIAPGTTFQHVACGAHFTCAITTAGERWCFGYNGAGELGNGRAWHGGFVPLP